VIIVDDHLLLRVLTGTPPAPLAGEAVLTTTGWWWRALAPVAMPRPAAGQHSRFVAGLSHSEADSLWDALCQVGQPGSLIPVPELVPLGPAMAWLARHEGLDRLAAEAVAAAMDLGAGISVRRGNEGRLPDVAPRYDIELVIS
jgi:hypothetical protein